MALAADLMATGRGYASLLDPESMAGRFDAVMNAVSIDQGGGVAFQIEYLLRPMGRGHPRALWIEDSGRWFAGPDGRPAEVVGVVRAIDERHRRDQELQFLSTFDPLTGFMNRGRLVQALGEALVQARRSNESCAFALAAINNLNVINDAYGFDVADEAIIAVSRRLRSVMRMGDAIGRYAGNKFGLVFHACSDQDLAIAAERLLDAVREQVIDTVQGPVWATISLGGVAMPRHAETVNEGLVRAEQALAEARRRPTDGFVGYKPSHGRDSVRERNKLCAAEMVGALKHGRFQLAYQPIVDAQSGVPAMHETLLRMTGPDGSVLPAAHIIPLAEKLGLVRLIDQRVIELAVGTLQRCPRARLSLNVSAVTAADARWFERIADFIASHEGITRRLTIEITETAALYCIDETTRVIGRLRDLGCSIAIDDFGAGYTSFRNLKDLNVDIVKLHGSFCDNLAENADNQYFVRTLIDLARKFHLKTVAEWIERRDDAELLKSWGIDYLQGNLFGAAAAELPWPMIGRRPAPLEPPGNQDPDRAQAAAPPE